MPKDEPNNIFEEASRSQKKKRKKPPKPTGPPPADEEVEKLLNRMHEMRRQLQKSIEKIYEKSEISRDEIESFLANPSNFSPSQWEAIKTTKEEWAEKAWEVVGTEARKQKKKKKKSLTDKKRKHKTLGARKKWLQM